MTRLYEIRSDLTQVNEMLAEFLKIENAELTDEQEQSLREILEKKEETEEAEAAKLESIVGLIKHSQAWAKIRKEEAERIKALATVDENRAKKLKLLLYEHLIALNLTRYRVLSSNLIISPNGGLRKLMLKEGCSPLDLPEKFQLRSVEFDPKAIREYLEAGGELDFAYLEPRGKSLKIT